VPEPEDLRSRNGELTVDLAIHNYTEANGSVRYCYTTPDGKPAPTLRLNPGDLLILNLKNELTDPGQQRQPARSPSCAGNRQGQQRPMCERSDGGHFNQSALPWTDYSRRMP
jgi:hypothetical protein